jgi:nitroimidazol reductase NimA-like FMN-containing flavoprotein (pyridoxamine 5'-phosphate oxidase superfamily)
MERVTTDPAGLARRILDDNLYLTLATADGDGRPWASPVYYARAADGELLWVSEPGTRHSRNIAARARASAVVFDSTVAPGTAQAVYVEGDAEEVAGPDLEPCVEAFSRRSQATGAGPWEEGDVTGDARLRLYRLRALGVWVLDGIGDDREGDRRIPVEL